MWIYTFCRWENWGPNIKLFEEPKVLISRLVLFSESFIYLFNNYWTLIKSRPCSKCWETVGNKIVYLGRHTKRKQEKLINLRKKTQKIINARQIIKMWWTASYLGRLFWGSNIKLKCKCYWHSGEDLENKGKSGRGNSWYKMKV